jgi:hypothetical protein
MNQTDIRVFRRQRPDDNFYFTVNQVEVDSTGNVVAISDDLVSADSTEELLHLVIHMLSAFTKPVIDASVLTQPKQSYADSVDAALAQISQKLNV